MMVAPVENVERDVATTRERSETYQSLAQAFRGPRNDVSARLRLPLPTQEIGAEFLAAFDPAISSSACSLCESAYVSEQRHALFEDLIRFYRYFGLERDSRAELPDHVIVELEFMHFLTFSEYTALSNGTETDGLRRAQRDFLSRHVMRLSKGIMQTCRTREPWCRSLVQTLGEFLDKERQSLETTLPGRFTAQPEPVPLSAAHSPASTSTR